MSTLILLGSCLLACGPSARPADTAAAGATTVARDSAVTRVSTGEVSRQTRDTGDYPVVRALYLNRFAAQSARKMRHLLAVADSTEINAFVIDMKDEFGLNFRSANEKYRRYEGTGRGRIPNVTALLDSLRAHNVMPIARIVAFKDPVAADANDAWTIRREDGSVWRDREGHAWVNTHNREVWEYNLGIAEELVKLGFQEIQWDYVRFPEPYRSLPRQVFPGATLSKPDALAAFLRLAQERVTKLGARNTADIFGLVTTVRGPLEVGQHWEKISPHVDVVLPMVYPSHYPRGIWGIARPNAEPYQILKIALDTARVRDEKLGITRKEHVRPWIQAFSLPGMEPRYGPDQIAAQKKAIYDAGFNGWVLWSPGSLYDAFIPALEKQDP